MQACIIISLLLVAGLAVDREAMAQGDWVDYRQVGRFHVRAEFRIDRFQNVASLVESLEDHEADVATTLGLTRSREPILVHLLANRRSYQTSMAKSAPEAVRRRAAFVHGEDVGRVYVYLHSGVVTDLRHEVTHAVLHSTLPFLPLWLDEGLAEYFEVQASERASGNPHQRSVKLSTRLPLGRLSPLEQLEKKRQLSAVTKRGYRDSWAWTHFLLHGPPAATRLLPRYLKSIEAHAPPEPMSVLLRQSDSDPTARLAAHFKSWK
jgi:hypothetical protein